MADLTQPITSLKLFSFQFKHMGGLLFWICAPFFKGPANFFGRRRKRSIHQNLDLILAQLNHSEAFIQRSISAEPSVAIYKKSL